MPRKKKPPPRAGQFGGARLAADQPDLASEHQPDLASEPDVANSVGNISKADNQKAAALSMLGRGVRGAGPPEPVCRALLLSSLDVVSFDTTKTNSSSYFSRPCDGSMLLDMASDPHAKLFGCAEPRRREGRDGLGAGG